MILELGPHRFDVTHRALVMGILNRTPDSFFDSGSYFDFDDFLRALGALHMASASSLVNHLARLGSFLVPRHVRASNTWLGPQAAQSN